MPIYEFTCHACGATFDTLRSFKDADVVLECTCCKSTDTHRQLSTFFSHTSGGSSHTSSSSKGGGCSGCSSGNCGSCSH